MMLPKIKNKMRKSYGKQIAVTYGNDGTRPLLSDHLPDNALGEEHRSQEVNVQHFSYLFDTGGDQQFVIRDTGGVDQNINSRTFLHQLPTASLHLLFDSQIAGTVANQISSL